MFDSIRNRAQPDARAIARALACAVLLAVAGCAAPPGTGPEPGRAPVRDAPPPAVSSAPTAPVAPAAPPAPALAGSSWYWLGTLTPAGLAAPADPGQYNLEFLDGGQLAVQVACNKGGATWRQTGRSLAIGPLTLGRNLCPGGSDAERFSRQLALVRTATSSPEMLDLGLGDAGTMLLSRDPDWRLRNFDCPNGAPLTVAFGRDQAVARWRTDSWLLRQQTTGSGTRYAAGNTILLTRGSEASLIHEGRQVAGPCTARR